MFEIVTIIPVPLSVTVIAKFFLTSANLASVLASLAIAEFEILALTLVFSLSTIYIVPSVDNFLRTVTVTLISFNISYPDIVLFSVITHLSGLDIFVIGCLLLSPLI